VPDHFEAAAEAVDRLVVEGVDGEPAAAGDAVQRLRRELAPTSDV